MIASSRSGRAGGGRPQAKAARTGARPVGARSGMLGKLLGEAAGARTLPLRAERATKGKTSTSCPTRIGCRLRQDAVGFGRTQRANVNLQGLHATGRPLRDPASVASWYAVSRGTIGPRTEPFVPETCLARPAVEARRDSARQLASVLARGPRSRRLQPSFGRSVLSACHEEADVTSDSKTAVPLSARTPDSPDCAAVRTA